MNRRNDIQRPATALSRRGFIERAGAATAASAAFLLATTALRAQEGPLKIGSMGPFTGPASRTGDEIKNGVALALEEAKADGDLPLKLGGKERDVEIVHIDSQSSPEKAVKAVTDAIDRQGVQFICNGWHSSVAMAVMDTEVPYKIIQLGNDVAFVGLPGEIFVELGLALKLASPYPYTFVNALSNGHIGYVPDRKALQEGGYGAAPGSTRCAPGSGEALIDSAIRQLLAHREIEPTE